MGILHIIELCCVYMVCIRYNSIFVVLGWDVLIVGRTRGFCIQKHYILVCDNYRITYRRIAGDQDQPTTPMEKNGTPSFSTNVRTGSLLEIFGSFDAGLRHQVANVLFEIVYSIAHVIDARDDLL